MEITHNHDVIITIVLPVVLLHRGQVVKVKGGITHEPEVSVLSAHETVATLLECTNKTCIMHKYWYNSVTRLPKTAIGL